MKKHVRFHHHLTFAFLCFVFRWYLYFKYKFRRRYLKLDDKGPHLIMFNHAANIDGYVIACSFRRPIYFVSTEHLFSVRGLSWLVDYLIAPIPIQKNRPDPNAVRKIIQVVKEGGSIGLVPEGNSTITGESPRLDKSLVKLIKLLGIPLVFCHIKGNYFANPRWGHKIRKNELTCIIKAIVKPQDYVDKNADEIYDLLKDNLYVNAYEEQLQDPMIYPSKASALYLERLLIVCPKCRAFDRLYSSGDGVYCHNCDLEMRLDKHGFFIDNPYELRTVIDWDNWQKPVFKSFVKAYPSDEQLFTPAQAVVLEHIKTNKRYSHKKKLGLSRVTMTKERFTITYKSHVVDYHLEEIEDVTIADKNQLHIYLKDANTLILLGKGRFAPYKYLMAYQIAFASKENKDPEFLGI